MSNAKGKQYDGLTRLHQCVCVIPSGRSCLFNMVCFYPERVPQKAISKSTAVRTLLALANRKQGLSYTFDPSATLFLPCACFYICFQTF